MLYETLNIKSNKNFDLQNKIIKSETTTAYLLLIPLYGFNDGKTSGSCKINYP